MKKIEFYRHNIGKKEIKDVNKVLKTLFLTTGSMTKQFEEEFARYLGAKNVLGLMSATAGLFLLQKALGIKNGDEVITTPLSFVATSNTIIECNAKPIFVDVEPSTGNINLDRVEEKITERTKAIIPVHLYGVMVNMKKLKTLAEKYNLKIIEDSAHCIEGQYEGIKPGQFSDGAAFSFYTTKNITSGEGGAVAVNNEELAQKIKTLRLHGMSLEAADRYTNKFKQYDVTEIGYKYNMFDIQAALLLNQLKLIEKRWELKNQLFHYYQNKLKELDEITLLNTPNNVKHSLHLLTILVNPNKREDIINVLQEKGIGVAINFKPIHLFSYYKNQFGYKEGMFPEAEKIGNSTISLPFYVKLKKKEVDYIINSLKQALI